MKKNLESLDKRIKSRELEGQDRSVELMEVSQNTEPTLTADPDAEIEQDGVESKDIHPMERMSEETVAAFIEHQNEMARKNGSWPRVETLIDKNCLVTFTGPMEFFDVAAFQGIIQQVVDARQKLEFIRAEAIKHLPKDRMPIMEVR
jgi:hypothetical protein